MTRMILFLSPSLPLLKDAVNLHFFSSNLAQRGWLVAKSNRLTGRVGIGNPKTTTFEIQLPSSKNKFLHVYLARGSTTQDVPLSCV